MTCSSFLTKQNVKNVSKTTQSQAIATNEVPFTTDEDARSVHPAVTQINAIVDRQQSTRKTQFSTKWALNLELNIEYTSFTFFFLTLIYYWREISCFGNKVVGKFMTPFVSSIKKSFRSLKV